MDVIEKEVILSEAEVNELRFIFANLNSPSRKEAYELAEVWRTKLTTVARKLHPTLPPPWKRY